MGADPGNSHNREDQQRRELEEIRNSFRQIGIRMGSLFEPAQENSNGAAEAQEAEAHGAEPPQAGQEDAERGEREIPALPPPPGRRLPRWVVPAVIAFVCLLAGAGLGYLVHRPAASPEPVPTVLTRTVTVTKTKPVAPPACLETARRGDESIDLLLRNVRDRRLSLAMKAYTVASQACRKEASP